MLTHPTLDLLTEFGLHGMAKGFQDPSTQPEAKGLEHADWLTLLLEREVTLRRQRRFEARARAATCATKPSSRTSPSAPPVASIAACSSA